MVGVFYHGALHSQAYSEEGDVIFPHVADGFYFTRDTPFSETRGYQYPIEAL